MAIAPLTEEQIAELKSKHAVMEGIEGPSCWLVFRKPTRHEYDRYLDSILADKSKARTSAWQLAQDTIVFPNAQALTDALEAEPAILLDNILPLVSRLAGDGKDRASLKL